MRSTTILAVSVALVCAGCEGGKTERAYAVQGLGSAELGKAVIQSFGCGSCHMIPGIPAAEGLVGPPLAMMGRRTYIAGQLPNTPENLVRWILSPKENEPGTAMPTLGLTDRQARDAASYLLTLR